MMGSQLSPQHNVKSSIKLIINKLEQNWPACELTKVNLVGEVLAVYGEKTCGTDRINLLEWRREELTIMKAMYSYLRTNQLNTSANCTCFSFSLCCRTIAMYFSISGSNFGSSMTDSTSPAAALPAPIVTVPAAGCSSALETFSTADC